MENRVLLIVTIAVTLLVLLAIPVYAATATVQIPASGWDYLGGEDSPATWSRVGQRLTLDDTEVLAIGYRVSRVGSPTGNVTLSIRDSATDAVIWAQVWGDASALPDANNSTYLIIDITPSLKVTGDVRICVEYYGGNEIDYVQAGYYSGDKITGEWYTNYVNYATDVTGWHNIGEVEEAAYYMSYVDREPDPIDGGAVIGIGHSWWIIGPVIGIVVILAIGFALLRKPNRGDNA